MKTFSYLSDLTQAEVLRLVELAKQLEASPDPGALAGKVLGLLFMNPSLRTLSSFQSAMARLGGDTFVISPGHGTWSLEWNDDARMDGAHAEHYREAIPVLGSYSDALGIRMFASGTNLEADLADTQFKKARAVCTVPVINMESAIDHPCQALADWKTLDDLEISSSGKFVLSWANHPKALPLAVPAATLKMAVHRGMDVTILRPNAYALPRSIMDHAQSLANSSGGKVSETDSVGDAMSGCDVLYAKSWGSSTFYGDAQMEEKNRASLAEWCVENSWFSDAARECKLMHCLPVRRDVVVASDVLDSPRSVVLPQAKNRMFAQMAVLHSMLSN
ncbi:MAG: N-acetylornithine carbamoyltransferase [Planctomycetota bacterium]|nr:N-acetylornithine carbamoyltransferase [Planctomycetota bacterium]